MKNISKKIFTAALFFTGFYLLLTLYSSPFNTHAQQSQLQTLFSPASGDLKINDEKVIGLSISSDSKISGFDLKFATNGPLSVTDFTGEPEFDNNLNPFDSKQIKEEISGSSSRVAYVFTTPFENLPKSVTLYLKIKGASQGKGEITLDYNNSQVLNGQGQTFQVTPLSASYNLNPNQSSPAFINPSSLPPIRYPDTTAIVKIKTKLYGAGPAKENIKATTVAVGRIGEGKYETTPQILSLTPNPDGTYSGTAAFPNFKDGNKFSLMVKADKYLLKRICNPDPAESKAGEYVCTEPNLTIRKGENSFDFSKVSLLPGDLGLTDGVLNGYDLAIVRNNLGKNEAEAVALADLNLDAIVDLKDFTIIEFIAGNTSRKADQ